MIEIFEKLSVRSTEDRSNEPKIKHFLFFVILFLFSETLNNSTNKSLSTRKINKTYPCLSQNEFNIRIKTIQWEINLFIIFFRLPFTIFHQLIDIHSISFQIIIKNKKINIFQQKDKLNSILQTIFNLFSWFYSIHII